MDEQQVKSLSIDELRQLISSARQANSSDYELLRKECVRRMHGWNRVLNCSGCLILSIFFLLALVAV